MPYLDHAKQFYWDSRAQYIMAMLCQTLGTTTFIEMPLTAVKHGATGYLIGYILAFTIVGIPILYMELIISQFTARDCIQVWKGRPCLSHIGYLQVVWQFLIIVHNHTLGSFIIHYFLVSFENPLPYYTCGKWSTKECGIVSYNYTVNQDCIKSREGASDYCSNIYKTFPEYQYWRNYVLGQTYSHYYVTWRVCLASGIACCALFISSFKRKHSLKWFLAALTIFPVTLYIILLLGSMMQKGIVSSFDEAIDAEFNVFAQNFRVSNIIQQVLHTLNIGTGLSFNLGASTSFRAPCYSNVVITVAVCAAFTILAVCTSVIMICPFSYEFGIKPEVFSNYPMALIFEKVPTLLKEYKHEQFWLIISYSANATLALSTTIIIFQHLLQMLAERYVIVDRYPGMTCFFCTIFLFFVTTPMFGNAGIYSFFHFKRLVNLITVFFTTLECFVFVMWYGVEKFAEDVHFMQGIQPKSFMKLAWLMSGFITAFVFVNELYYLMANFDEIKGSNAGWWLVHGCIGFIVLVSIFRLLIAAIKKRLWEEVTVDQAWGPRSEVLMRSRAMFSAQAMTKEYIYRQYHLQAGILARQRTSNIRRSYNV